MSEPTAETGHLCLYCGVQQSGPSKSLEHVVPESVGGNEKYEGDAPDVLTTWKACDACNNLAGRTIDYWFAKSEFIMPMRAAIAATGKNGQPPMVLGRLDWSEPETVDVFQAGSFYFTVVRLADGKDFADAYALGIAVTALAPDMRRWMEKMRKAIGQKKPPLASSTEPRLAALHQRLSSMLLSENATARYTRLHYPAAMEREVLKILLGLCGGIWPAFIQSTDWRKVQAAAFGTDPRPAEALVRPLRELNIFAFAKGTGADVSHIIRLRNQEGAARLEIDFYGQAGYRIDFVSGDQAPCDYEWVIDPEAKTGRGTDHLRRSPATPPG